MGTLPEMTGRRFAFNLPFGIGAARTLVRSGKKIQPALTADADNPERPAHSISAASRFAAGDRSQAVPGTAANAI
jgi:hypothetical protein